MAETKPRNVAVAETDFTLRIGYLSAVTRAPDRQSAVCAKTAAASPFLQLFGGGEVPVAHVIRETHCGNFAMARRKSRVL